MQIPFLSTQQGASRSPALAVLRADPAASEFAAILAKMRGQGSPSAASAIATQAETAAEQAPSADTPQTAPDSDAAPNAETETADPLVAKTPEETAADLFPQAGGDPPPDLPTDDAVTQAKVGTPTQAAAPAGETGSGSAPLRFGQGTKTGSQDATETPDIGLVSTMAAGTDPAQGPRGSAARGDPGPVGAGPVGAGPVGARPGVAFPAAQGAPGPGPAQRPSFPMPLPPSGVAKAPSADGAAARSDSPETPVATTVATPPVSAPAPAPVPGFSRTSTSLGAQAALDGSFVTDEAGVGRGDAAFGPAGADSVTSGRPPVSEGASVPQAAPRALASQIAVALGQATDGTIDLSLHPKELGRLRLSLSPTEQGLVVTVTADRPETLDLMRRHAADLGQDLRAMGFREIDLNFAGPGADHFRGHAGKAENDEARIGDPVQSGATAALARPPSAPAMPVGGGLDIRL